MSEQPPTYDIGQVVNGHRWTGSAWEPVSGEAVAAPASETAPETAAISPSPPPPPVQQYAVGDVQNGHVWSGTEWIAVNATQTSVLAPTAEGAVPKKKKRRIFLWVFLAVQALFIVWIIAGASSSNSTANCGSLSASDCQAAAAVGTGIGVFIIIVLWVIVDILLGIGYGVYRLAKRP